MGNTANCYCYAGINQIMKSMECPYEIALEEALKEIKKCQNDTMKTQTCFGCAKFFSCHTRQDYVKKVYSSMSKDKAGNFEFN